MKRRNAALLLLLIFLSSFAFCGCWNYTDIEKYSIVSGFSIDKSEEDNKYLLTVEVIDFETSGKEAKQVPKHIHSEGTTVFDAIRNIINETGKRLYWGHANLMVISETVAREGIMPVMDLAIRDAEIREEMYVLICAGGQAKEIFEQRMLISLSGADTFVNMIKNQKSIGKAPYPQVYEVVEKLEEEGESIALPVIHEVESDNRMVAKLVGCAVFKSDKLVGYLSPDETKYYLFAKNLFKEGLITVNEHAPSNIINDITLEVYKSNSKIKPIYKNNKISMDVEIKSDVAIAEVETSIDYMSEKEQLKLKKDAEKKVTDYTKNVIEKVQKEYNSDIFGFGRMVMADMPDVWKQVNTKWDKIFKTLEVNVKTEISIKNSDLVSKPIKKGD